MGDKGHYLFPLSVTRIINNTVLFRPKRTYEETLTSVCSAREKQKDGNDQLSKSKIDLNNNKDSIFDVLETNRPPDLPQHWFYPPGCLGPFQWSKNQLSVGRGLINYANTCFLNATIQALAYCPPFSQDCLAGRHSARCLRKQRNQVCGFCEFELLIKGLLSPSHKQQNNQSCGRSVAAFSPLFVKLLRKEIKMNQGESSWYGIQNCAHEWLVQFIDLLSRYDLPPELQNDFQRGRLRGSDIATCYLQQLLSTCLQESKICQECHKSTANYELHTCIKISLSDGCSSLETALQKTFKPELLTGGNRPTCDACGVPRDKISRRFLYRPPNILALLLQRAEFRNFKQQTSSRNDRYFLFNSVQKNCVQMKVPLTLDLNEFISAEGKEFFGCSGSNIVNGSLYDFSASVNHTGSAGFGHYWSIVLGPDGCYYKLDDELVTQVPPSSLLQQLGSSYLLFYTRRTPVEDAAPVVKAGETVTLYKSQLANSQLTRNPVNINDNPTVPEIEEHPWTISISLGVNGQRRDESIGSGQSNPVSHQTIGDQTNLKDGDSKGFGSSAMRQMTLQDSSIPDSIIDEMALFHKADDNSNWDNLNGEPDMEENGDCDGSEDSDNDILQSPAGVYYSLLRDLLTHNWNNEHPRYLSRRLRHSVNYSHALKKRQRFDNNTMKPVSDSENTTTKLRLSTSSEHSSDSSLKTMRNNPSKFNIDNSRSDSTTMSEFDTVIPKKHSKLVQTTFKPQVKMENLRSVKSQYENQRVDGWDDMDNADIKANFEDVQRQLLPQTHKRDRHDMEYDRGKTKKIKKQKKQMFNFAQKADQLTARLKNESHHTCDTKYTIIVEWQLQQMSLRKNDPPND